jgi:hypothetical protein
MLAKLSKYIGINNVPNAVSRATGYSVDGNVGGSIDNRDAIITCGNDSFSYSHIVGMANMDSISVWTVLRGNYVKIACPYGLAVSDE